MPNMQIGEEPPFVIINNKTGNVSGYYMDLTQKILNKVKLNYTYVDEFSSYSDIGINH